MRNFPRTIFDNDIYSIQRTEAAWSDRVNLGPGVKGGDSFRFDIGAALEELAGFNKKQGVSR